jgi:DNA-binding HxlR family transcriptional regulator
MRSGASRASDPPASLPRVGAPVAGSTTGQPIMVLFDLLGRRWAMGILWNLASANRTFRDLQTRCGSASPTVLNTRLKELRMAGLVEKAPDGYALTADGRALFEVLAPLGDWAMEWAPRMARARGQGQ